MSEYFQAGKPVSGNDIVGRDAIISEIIDLTLRGQSVVIIAPRRYGKTSVVLEVLQRLERLGHFQAYIDVFLSSDTRILSEKITESVLSNKKLGTLFHQIKKNINGLIKQVEFKQVIQDNEFILDFADPLKDPRSLLESSLNFINHYAEKNNKNIVCAFDEFGDVEKFGGNDIVKFIRSVIQHHQNAGYIFSGSYESVMNQLFIQSKAPFYRFARIINLGRIDINCFKTEIQRKFELLKVHITEDAIVKILEFTKGHPYYTQIICQEIELAASRTNRRITRDQIESFIDGTVWREINYIEKTWEEVSRHKENISVLLHIASGQKELYGSLDLKRINVSRTIKRLITTGLVEHRDRRYILTDPLLERWLINKVV